VVRKPLERRGRGKENEKKDMYKKKKKEEKKGTVITFHEPAASRARLRSAARLNTFYARAVPQGHGSSFLSNFWGLYIPNGNKQRRTNKSNLDRE
jgi:hypothetical protein